MKAALTNDGVVVLFVGLADLELETTAGHIRVESLVSDNFVGGCGFGHVGFSPSVYAVIIARRANDGNSYFANYFYTGIKTRLQPVAPYAMLRPMTLDQYLTRNKMTATDMAIKLGRAVSTVTRIRKGEIKPDFDTIQEIVDMTGGRVTPNDFFVMPKRKRGGS